MKAFILVIAIVSTLMFSGCRKTRSIISTLMFSGCKKNEEYNPQNQAQRLQQHTPFTPMKSATRLTTDPTGKVMWDANDQLSVLIADTRTPEQ